MKLNIEFNEGTRAMIPIRHMIQTGTDWLCPPLSFKSALKIHLRKFIAKFGDKMKIQVGYQAETGFHFGVEPVPE